ncbi:ead/Ea22-like family protein [Salmonella enterica]|nr:ead/Ea22-like family protein [Salmonella enterica]ELV9458787.1 ead/Ea22-like family protein [Salmonella enterica]
MVERFSMNPVSCKLLNEAWGKEFPDEVAIAERMLALLDENIQLQREKDAIEAVALALRDDMRQARERLEATVKRIAEQREYYEGVIADGSKRIAELKARTVKLPKPIIVLHRRDFTDAYRAIYAYPEAEVNAALAAAGIKVKGE